MTRREFELAVSEMTGEDLQVIHQRGFELIDLTPSLTDDDTLEAATLLAPYLDWDHLETA